MSAGGTEGITGFFLLCGVSMLGCIACLCGIDSEIVLPIETTKTVAAEYLHAHK